MVLAPFSSNGRQALFPSQWLHTDAGKVAPLLPRSNANEVHTSYLQTSGSDSCIRLINPLAAMAKVLLCDLEAIWAHQALQAAPQPRSK